MIDQAELMAALVAAELKVRELEAELQSERELRPAFLSAWEALEPAVNRPQRFYGEKAYERLRLAQARVEALKGGTT